MNGDTYNLFISNTLPFEVTASTLVENSFSSVVFSLADEGLRTWNIQHASLNFCYVNPARKLPLICSCT